MSTASQTTRLTRIQDQRRKMGCFGRTLVAFIIIFALLVFAGVGSVIALLSSSLTSELQDGIDTLANARDRRSFETTIINDRNGETLWEIFGEGKRTIVPIDKMPLEIKAATIAVEDDSFYTNKGFEETSLIAAIIYNYRNPESRPVGGSTITQQLVRHIAFSNEERLAVSYRRKVKELFLSWRMTQDFTKDEILAMYLNEIYYGNFAYGIEAASQTYFDKAATELTLGEASLLAGLPQAPIGLDPYTNFEAAQARQFYVLTLMLEEGMINQQQLDDAFAEQLSFAEQTVSLNAPHFAIEVRRELEEMFGPDVVANDGLRVTTTLDMRYQRLAEQLAREQVAELADANVTNSALVAMQPQTGEVLAMLGSVDYRDDAIDGQVNITTSLQQPGSTFKPLTFALALQSGWQPADVVWDVPVRYPQLNGNIYEPVNYDGLFHGPMRLREALANSYNIPALELADAVGVEPLLNFARLLGMTSLSTELANYGISLTLGGGEVTPLEMTSAYGVLANGGRAVTPLTILRVTNARGELLHEAQAQPTVQLLEPETAFVISDMLADDVARLPAMGADNPLELPFTAAAKTGTTNDFRDNWTIGYTPGLVVSVWAGNTDNSPMVDVSGLSGAAPLWNAFMQAVYADDVLLAALAVGEVAPRAEFAQPSGLVKGEYCDLDELPVEAERCDSLIQEWVLAGAADLPEETLELSWLEPSVMRALSAPQLAANVAAGGVQAKFCRVGEGRWPSDTTQRLFITAPRSEALLPFAQAWANQNGVMIEPVEFCNGQAVANTGGPWTPTPEAGAPPAGSGSDGSDVVASVATSAAAFPTLGPITPQATFAPNQTATPVPTPIPPTATPVVLAQAGGARYGITSPAAGAVLNTSVPLLGSADFDPSVVQFYKIEIRKANGGDWVSIGSTHDIPVSGGFLEILPADGLLNSAEWGAGNYVLRLVLVKWDGNHVGAPFEMPFSIR